jgi:hypothetical protein
VKQRFYVILYIIHKISDADPDPNPDLSDPYVFGPPGSGSGFISQRYGTGSRSGSFYYKEKIVRKTLIPTAFVTSWAFKK